MEYGIELRKLFGIAFDLEKETNPLRNTLPESK